MKQLPARAALVLGGAAISTFWYAMTIRAHLGLGPLFAVQGGMAERTGLSVGTCVMIVGVVLVALAMFVRQMPGIGTFSLPFITGWMLDRMLPHIGDVTGWVPRFGVIFVGTWFMCLGGALVIRAAMGAAAIDGVMLGLSAKTGQNVRRVRLGMEAFMLLLGWILGGSIGVGTVITALLVGPYLHFWLNLVDKKDADEIHITV